MALLDEESMEAKAIAFARSGDLDGLLVMSMNGYDILPLRRKLLCWMLHSGGDLKFTLLKDYLDNKSKNK